MDALSTGVQFEFDSLKEVALIHNWNRQRNIRYLETLIHVQVSTRSSALKETLDEYQSYLFPEFRDTSEARAAEQHRMLEFLKDKAFAIGISDENKGSSSAELITLSPEHIHREIEHLRELIAEAEKE